MQAEVFRISLYLPSQAATETEATIIEWQVAEGASFRQGQVLGQMDSVKSVFDFEAPCDGRVIRLLRLEGDTIGYGEPVMEIETGDPQMRDWIPPAAAVRPLPAPAPGLPQENGHAAPRLLGVGGYLPERIVTNAELVENFPDVSAEYVYQVTGIRQRHWAREDEKPSDMAFAAALEAIRKARITIKDIDAIIVSTTTPDAAMPATACILQDRLGLRGVTAFDVNAACSGWLYSLGLARGMILGGLARNVLTVAVDMQSRLLDRNDRSTTFIFGDGAGAAIVGPGPNGHVIRRIVLGSDVRGLHMARRDEPGYEPRAEGNGNGRRDPWIRLDGPALFRFATESLIIAIRDLLSQTGWNADDVRCVIPHQANGRILRAVAKRSHVSFDRFHLNIDRVGNTSSASIPLAICEAEESLRPGDKVVLCSVGAGATLAAVAVEW